jgi:hypothetical protein
MALLSPDRNWSCSRVVPFSGKWHAGQEAGSGGHEYMGKALDQEEVSVK